MGGLPIISWSCLEKFRKDSISVKNVTISSILGDLDVLDPSSTDENGSGNKIISILPQIAPFFALGGSLR